MPKTNQNKDDKQTTQNTADDAIKQMEKMMFDLPTAPQDPAKSTKKPCRACMDFKSWTKNLTGAQPKVNNSLFSYLMIFLFLSVIQNNNTFQFYSHGYGNLKSENCVQTIKV